MSTAITASTLSEQIISVYRFVLMHQHGYRSSDVYKLKPILTFTRHRLNSRSIILKALCGPLLCTTRCTSSSYTGSKLISSTSAAAFCNSGLWEEMLCFVVCGEWDGAFRAVAARSTYGFIFASSLDKITVTGHLHLCRSIFERDLWRWQLNVLGDSLFGFVEVRGSCQGVYFSKKNQHFWSQVGGRVIFQTGFFFFKTPSRD